MLSGLARVEKDKRNNSEKYISMLGHGKGRASFEFVSEEDGECDFTLCIKKCGRYEKISCCQCG